MIQVRRMLGWAVAKAAFLICFGSGQAVYADSTCPDSFVELGAVVDRFLSEPSDADEGVVFQYLKCKLNHWDRYPGDYVASILDVIGDRNLEEAWALLVEFVEADSSLSGSQLFRSAAIIAIGQLDAPGSYEQIAALVTASESEHDLAAAAISLGYIQDPRALSVLTHLAHNESPGVRKEALAALSRTCDSDTRELARVSMGDPDLWVRVSAMFWFSTCASSRADVRILVHGLGSPIPLVRKHALRGLIRIKEDKGCDKIENLARDEFVDVRQLAEQYQVICSKSP